MDTKTADPPTDVRGDRRTDDLGLDARQRHRVKIAFAVAALLSLALSVGIWLSGDRMQAIFVGLWVPSIHSLGTLLLVGENRR